MNLSTEELVNRVVAEVFAELKRRGLTSDSAPPQPNPQNSAPALKTPVHVVDMSGFRSPVLLESHLASLPPEVKEIAVPPGTVITPGAREIIRNKNLKVKNIPTTK